MIPKKLVFLFLLSAFLITYIHGKPNNNTATPCKITADCRNYHSCQQGFCLHKPFYSPFTFNEILLSVLLGIISGLCMAVGVGGGIYYIPLLSTLGSFYIKEVIPISNFLICISSLVTFIYNFSKKHPMLEFRSLIDYNLGFTLLPTLCIGVYIGFIINLVSPTIILFFMLTIIFCFLNYSVISK